MEPLIKSVFFYFLPGLMAAGPYWAIWPIRRSLIDVIAAVAGSAMCVQGIARIASSFCESFLGGTMMFGQRGEVASIGTLSLMGITLGVLLGRHCDRCGPGYYPFSPIPVR